MCVLVGTRPTSPSDSATQISAIVPADAVSGLIRVAIGASVAKSDSKFTVGKTLGIGSFTPTSGGVGTRVVITGRGFSSVTGVRFGGTPASNITVDSTTQITAVVPSGAASGRIEVDSGGRSATTVAAFTVTATTVRSFSPESGNAGDTVTLVGENLDAVVEVRFTGGATSTFAVTPDGRGLSVQVPAGTVTGSITVVTTDGPTGVGGVFHVLPKLTSISHGAQASHDTDSFSFRLHGEQLSDVVDVDFAGTPVTWSLVDDSEIDVTVPTDGPRWGTFHLTVPSPDGQSIDSPVAGVGIDTVLVVLVSPGGQEDDATPASADFAFNSRANEWFHRVSYGKFAISATVTPWLPIAQVSGCDLTTLTNESDAAMRTAGYSPSGYDHVVYYFPDRPACSFLGVATVGGSQVWLDGDLTTDTITHELGHNLGLRHANLLRCTDASGQPVTESDTCTTVEYGDPYSVMGGGGSYTASERDYIGWLNGRVTTVTTSGIYSLDPTEIPQSGALALKIPVGNKVYWLEYRYPSDPDTFIEGSACDWQGVQVRESPADNSGISSLLEFGPDTSCASLAWGSSWTDPTGELTINSLGSPVTGTTGMHVVITLQSGPTNRWLREAFPGLTYQRDGLGENHANGVANRVGLFAGSAGQLHPADGRDRDSDCEVDRLVGKRDLLALLRLFHERRHLALQLFGVPEHVSKAEVTHRSWRIAAVQCRSVGFGIDAVEQRRGVGLGARLGLGDAGVDHRPYLGLERGVLVVGELLVQLEPRPEACKRILLGVLRKQFAGHIGRVVVDGVALHPQGHQFEHRRAATRAGLLDRAQPLAVHGEHVSAVHHDSLEAVRGAAVGQVLAGVLEPVGRRVGELVVVDHVHDGELAHPGEVHRLVHVAAGRGAVATPAKRHAVLFRSWNARAMPVITVIIAGRWLTPASRPAPGPKSLERRFESRPPVAPPTRPMNWQKMGAGLTPRTTCTPRFRWSGEATSNSPIALAIPIDAASFPRPV